MHLLWLFGGKYNEELFFCYYTAPYVDEINCDSLIMLFSDLIHLTYLTHEIHNICECITTVNKCIRTVEKIVFKAPSQVIKLIYKIKYYIILN